MTRDYVVKMSNLRNFTDKKIKDLISNLFNNYLFISLNVKNLDINQERQTLCAIIYLKSHEEVEITLDKLCTRRSRDKLGFKFRKLVMPKEELEVEKLKFYRLGENIGLKNSTRAFRSGTGNYIEKKLKRDVIRYICGFLNCIGQGRLYIGVNKTGNHNILLSTHTQSFS